MQPRLEGLTVGDVMTREVVTVAPRTDLREVKQLFETHEFNAIPVVDARGVVLGLLTKLDLLRAFRPDRRRLLPDLRSIQARYAEDLMSRGFVEVHPGDDVIAAVDLMLDLNLRSLPVTERDAEGPLLVGMLSRTDVLRCFVFDEPRSG